MKKPDFINEVGFSDKKNNIIRIVLIRHKLVITEKTAFKNNSN